MCDPIVPRAEGDDGRNARGKKKEKNDEATEKDGTKTTKVQEDIVQGEKNGEGDMSGKPTHL